MIKNHNNPLNSLASLCIREVVKLETRLCSRMNLVPPPVRQEILNHLIQEKKQMDLDFVTSLLIPGGMTSIDVWQLAEDEMINASSILALFEAGVKNCLSLKTLSVGGSCWIYDGPGMESVMTLLKKTSFPVMTKLRIQELRFGKDLVSLLHSCPNLRDLEICQPCLSDANIDQITRDLSNVSCLTDHVSSLTLPSSVKGSGILVFLSICRRLHKLQVGRFDSVLEEIEREERTNESKDILENTQGHERHSVVSLTQVKQRLKCLQSLTVNHPLGFGSIRHLVSLCPSLHEISLQVQECMDLSSLLSLNNLRSVELKNSGTASFAEHVLPIIEGIGMRLECLSIEGFDILDLRQCASLCPNLSHLSLKFFSSLTFHPQPRLLFCRPVRRTPFLFLRYLCLRPRSQKIIDPDTIHYLTDEACDLEYLELYHCQDLCDENLKKIKSSNGLINLESLILGPHHSLSNNFLSTFLFNCPALGYMDFGQEFINKKKNTEHQQHMVVMIANQENHLLEIANDEDVVNNNNIIIVDGNDNNNNNVEGIILQHHMPQLIL